MWIRCSTIAPTRKFFQTDASCSVFDIMSRLSYDTKRFILADSRPVFYSRLLFFRGASISFGHGGQLAKVTLESIKGKQDCLGGGAFRVDNPGKGVVHSEKAKKRYGDKKRRLPPVPLPSRDRANLGEPGNRI